MPEPQPDQWPFVPDEGLVVAQAPPYSSRSAAEMVPVPVVCVL